ncbi:unnamed protein product [Ixodes persulcatus]
MRDVCLSCNELLPSEGFFSKCSESGNGYHFDSCSDVDQGAYEVEKKTWKCHTCSASKTRSGKLNAETKRDNETDVGKALVGISKQLSELLAMKEIVDSLMSVKENVDSLMTVKETVDNIEASVQHMSDAYDEVLKVMKQQSTEITKLKNRVEKMEADKSGEEVIKLKQEVNKLEQYSRRQNLEIHGLPRSSNEDLLKKINDVANELELRELTESDVDGFHRLPSKDGKIPAVLVRFVSRVTRDQWLQRKGRLRDNQSDVRLFDNLTAQNKNLLWMMRAKAEEKHYQFAWQKDGRMFMRKKQGDSAVKIECIQDLERIV